MPLTRTRLHATSDKQVGMQTVLVLAACWLSDGSQFFNQHLPQVWQHGWDCHCSTHSWVSPPRVALNWGHCPLQTHLPASYLISLKHLSEPVDAGEQASFSYIQAMPTVVKWDVLCKVVQGRDPSCIVDTSKRQCFVWRDAILQSPDSR